MGKIWNDENKFSIWLEIEILAGEAQATLGVIPKDTVNVKVTFVLLDWVSGLVTTTL